MFIAEQIEKSGEHHDKRNAQRTEILKWFAIPFATIVTGTLISMMLVGMGAFADVAFAFSQWARGVSQHPIQYYAEFVLRHGWKALLVLIGSAAVALFIFDTIVIRTWTKK